jgi:pyruvate,water dikinase
MAGILPPTVRHSVPSSERWWRDEVRPRYRAAVERAETEVEALPVAALPDLIDRLADLAGESFACLAALAGAGYKLEINLARFYRRHLQASLGGSHLSLLAGIAPPADPGRHAVASLDWAFDIATAKSAIPSADEHARLVAARKRAEEAAFTALGSSPGRLRTFRRLLADAQHLVPVREEQVAELTIAWPAMRRAVLRIGEALVERGLIQAAADVFYVTRHEALAALDGQQPGGVDVAARRATREEQAMLVPPLFVGRVNPALKKLVDAFPAMVGAVPSDTALVSGSPASPGRATGAVRVVRGPQDFDALQPGEVLVAPLTAPAWTPLFGLAIAVVTDVGSAAAHASVIAREYGIPAVVGCGDATARLRTGMLVTVDGNTGNVEAGSPSE